MRFESLNKLKKSLLMDNFFVCGCRWRCCRLDSCNSNVSGVCKQTIVLLMGG